MRVIVAVAVAVEASVGVTDGVGNSVAAAITGGAATGVASARIGVSVPIGPIAAGDMMHPANTSSNSNIAVTLNREKSRIIREYQSD